MKKFLNIFGLLFFIVMLSCCEPVPSTSNELSRYIPKNASLVIKIQDFKTLESDISNNGFLSYLKKSSPYSFFTQNIFFSNIHPSSTSLLCISPSKNKSDFTFITKQTDGLFNLDSIPNSSVKEMTHHKQSFQSVIIEDQQIYTMHRDSVFIASSSLLLIQKLQEGETLQDPLFKKIEVLNASADLTTIIPLDGISLNDSLSVNFASWAALDIAVLPNALTASGVVLENDTIPQLVSVFKGLIPQQNDIAKVTPTDALNVISFTFNDFELFQNNINRFQAFKKANNSQSLILESISEVGNIEFSTGDALVFKSIDPTLTNEVLASFMNPKESYKEVIIYDFNKPDLFSTIFSPLLKNSKLKYLFRLDDFFIFTENMDHAQQIISSFLNNNALSTKGYYQKALSQLSDESSLFIMNLNGNYSNIISNLLNTEIGDISFKKYPLAILQFSYDRNFAHVNFVCSEALEKKQSSEKVSQLISIQLEDELMGELTFFSNHRTGGKDIIAQDITNKLYFISARGKTLWTKKLDGPILGGIKEVDLLRNRKKQLAFTTKNTFYILDRTGRKVSPFPIKFKDEITQPLSVFDYDTNRNYRFLITQGNEVFMINSKGKTVKGFTFKKTKSEIVLAPQHIRMTNKDYILIAEKNGKLNILSRVGKSRLSVSNSFNFSEIAIAKEGEKFVVITKDPKSSGQLKNSISQDGKVTTLKLNVTAYWFTINGKIKVTLDDNLMRINGKLVELPYGIYTPPKIISTNQKTYISITETQENKVYVYNKLGELVPGFPIFGTSSIDIGDANNNGKIDFLVKGDKKEVLLFELQ